MKNLNYVLLKKINLLLKQFFNDQQISDVLDRFEKKSIPKNQPPLDRIDSNLQIEIPNHRIEQRMIIDKAITFSKEKLERDKYSLFQLEIAKILTEGDNLNMAEEILLTTISENQSEFYYAESLLAMADILLRKSFWSDSNTLIDKAKEVFTNLDNKIGLAKCENLYGTSYGERGEVQQAKNHFLSGIDLLTENADEKVAAELETNLAIIENICGNLNESQEHFFNALNIFKNLNETKRIAELRHNIGMLLFEHKKYGKAIEEFEKGILIARKENYQTILAISYLAMANSLLYMGNYESTLKYSYMAMDIAISIEDRLTIADVYRIIGMLERKLKHYDIAEKYLQISLRLNEELGNKLNTAESSYEMAMVYNELGNDQQKKYCLQESLKYYSDIDAKEKVKIIEEMLEPELN